MFWHLRGGDSDCAWGASASSFSIFSFWDFIFDLLIFSSPPLCHTHRLYVATLLKSHLWLAGALRAQGPP